MHARVAAMGEALVADSSSFESFALNPANLYSTGSTEAVVSRLQWIQDIQTNWGAVKLPFSFGTFGVSLANTNVGGIEVRDVPGPPITTFTSHSAVFQGAFATRVTNELTLGVSARYLYEKIYVDESSGFDVGVGTLFDTPLPGLTFGAAVINLGNLGAFRSEHSATPEQLQAGATYELKQSDFEFTVAAALANDLGRKENRFFFGGEAVYDAAIFLRGGYQTGYESRGISAGLGLAYRFLKLDYAYVPFNLGLGEAHIVSVGFMFQ